MAYTVPGITIVIAQRTSLVCWAAVYAMMRSWRDRKSYDPATAVAMVSPKYRKLYDGNQVLPSYEFGPFMSAAGMRVESMQNKTIAAWEKLLRDHGLLWVGTMNSLAPGAGLHSRVIHAISGAGTASNTRFGILDPAHGRRYDESFEVFSKKYEGAFRSVSGEYFQIRHY
jgi:hypothetical protein